MSLIAAPTPFPAAVTLAESRNYCRQLTKRAARNFYYGLKLLPEPKRSSMFALYAWMRLVDDIADDEGGRTAAQRASELDAWGTRTQGAIAEAATASDASRESAEAARLIEARRGPALGVDVPEADTHPLWPAFADMVHRHAVPATIFDHALAGQRQDLQPVVIESFPQLAEYCFRVAGVVGLASIHVWGFTGGEATEQLAIERGLAFQLTNILRDLREDAARGRTYLPHDELDAAGLTIEELQRLAAGQGRDDGRFARLMRQQIARAQAAYDKSADLERRIQPDSRPTLAAMTDIYHSLLLKIAADPARVLRERVSLSIAHKLRIGWRASRARMDGAASV